MAEKEKTETRPDWMIKFKEWVLGRTGLTMVEFAEAFADIFNLTTKEREALVAYAKTEDQKELEREKERKRKEKKEEEERKKKEEEERKKKKEEEEKKKGKKVPPELIIGRTPYPKWWKDARTHNININQAGSWPIIPQTPGHRTYLGNIVFTVSGETNIVMKFGIFPATGPMNFGGEGQPMGIVMAMGDSPAPCGDGGFTISSDGADVLVSGFVTYYYEKE